MTIHDTELQNNLYSILDRIIETGDPVIIERNGYQLTIEAKKSRSKFERLTKHDILNGDPESIVHMDWSDEWKQDNNQ